MLVTNGVHLDSSVLGLHSVTVLKSNMEHYEKMKSRARKEVSLRQHGSLS